MKAPDKIYLQHNITTDLYDEFWPEWFEGTNHPDRDICYIRKDIVDETIQTAEDHAYFAGKEKMREELLERVRLAYGKLSMNPFDVQDVFEELIDKLNSM